MKIKLLNYNNEIVEKDIGDINDILSIYIHVVSGDEIAEVIYKDRRMVSFDPSDNRIWDFEDGYYNIYRYGSEQNLIDDEKFKNRKSSYEYWY